MGWLTYSSADDIILCDVLGHSSSSEDPILCSRLAESSFSTSMFHLLVGVDHDEGRNLVVFWKEDWIHLFER